MIVRAYFLMPPADSDAATLVPVLRTVPQSSATLRAAFAALLAGPNAKERAAYPPLETLVPTGTRLLSVKLVNGIATVDLSREFFANGYLVEVEAKVGQVVYTLTQFPGVRRVAFLMEGAAVPGVGAAWRLVAKPIGRDTFGDLLLPPIFVDRPAWGAAYLTGTEITGIANVFEAQFRIELRDAAGNVLDEAPVTASCGTGCWGTFSVRLHYDVAKWQWGELRVFDISEADSTVVGLRVYPVWLRA